MVESSTPVGRRRWLLRRFIASILLSLLFLVVYGTGQFVASSRDHVPSFYFSWEHHVPFVAAMIVPYFSINLFFVAAPLLIRTDRELRTVSLRVAAAIVVAGVVFLLMPLKFAFDRPSFGPMFEWFHTVDLPFNQLPSLHVALLLIVGQVFIRRSRGWVRATLLVWFSLIGVSPLLVQQHHVTDLFAGLALGLACLNLIRDGAERS